MTLTAVRRVAVTAVLWPHIGVAQPPAMQPGVRLRIETRTNQRPFVGTLMTQTAETLVVASSSIAWHRIPADVVRRIDYSTGQSRKAAGIIGFVVGALAAASVAVTTVRGNEPYGKAGTVAGVATIGGFVGAAFGSVAPIELWHRWYEPDRPVRERDRLRIRGTP